MQDPYLLKNAKVLIIAGLWPEVSSSAAGLRSDFLIRTLLESGAALHFAATGASNPWQRRLQELGVQTTEIRPNDPSFDVWIQELGPDIVIFERFHLEEQFSWRVARGVPNAVRILDTHDLHSLRSSRERGLLAPPPTDGMANFNQPAKSKTPAVQSKALSEKIWLSMTPIEWGGRLDLLDPHFLREMAAITRSHLTWVVSDWELRLLTELIGLPPESLRLTAWDVPLDGSVPDFESRIGFCHIGNFRHSPNMDSLEVLIKNLWPKIRENLPHSTLSVYGAYPTPKALQLIASKQATSLGVSFGGSPENARHALCTHRVNLAPLRFGAGIKGKLLDGAASGTPSVTTPIGAEGMSRVICPTSITRTDSEFVQTAVKLHEDSDFWEETRAFERKGLLSNFGYGQLSRQLCEELGHALLQNQKRDRAFWIRAMLLQDTTRATEYLSRWITLKNRTTESGPT